MNLALSLHAPTQELRTRIVPSARAYPLPRLMDAVDEYIHRTGRTVMMEYVLLKGVNDSDEVAHQLGRLLQGRLVMVNIIPYNPNYAVGIEEFDPPSDADTERFCAIVRDQYALYTTVRAEMGQDVSGACGQLALVRMPTQAGEKATFEEGVEGMGEEVDGTGSRAPPRAAAGGDDDTFAIEDLGRPLTHAPRGQGPSLGRARAAGAGAGTGAATGGGCGSSAGGCCGGKSVQAGQCCKGEEAVRAGLCCKQQQKQQQQPEAGAAQAPQGQAPPAGCCGGKGASTAAAAATKQQLEEVEVVATRCGAVGYTLVLALLMVLVMAVRAAVTAHEPGFGPSR